MEMGLDAPDLPIGMLSNVHLNRCKNLLNLLSLASFTLFSLAFDSSSLEY